MAHLLYLRDPQWRAWTKRSRLAEAPFCAATNVCGLVFFFFFFFTALYRVPSPLRLKIGVELEITVFARCRLFSLLLWRPIVPALLFESFCLARSSWPEISGQWIGHGLLSYSRPGNTNQLGLSLCGYRSCSRSGRGPGSTEFSCSGLVLDRVRVQFRSSTRPVHADQINR